MAEREEDEQSDLVFALSRNYSGRMSSMTQKNMVNVHSSSGKERGRSPSKSPDLTGEISHGLMAVQIPEVDERESVRVDSAWKPSNAIQEYWSELLLEGPKGKGASPIFWDSRTSRIPPRVARANDIVDSPLPRGWESLGERVVRDPSGQTWMLTRSNRLLNRDGSGLDETVVAHIPNDPYAVMMRDTYVDEDGYEHFGDKSALLPAGVILDNAAQIGGTRVPGSTNDNEFEPQDQTMPNETIVVRMGLINGVGASDINLPMEAVYGTISYDGVEANYRHQSVITIAGAQADIQVNHAGGNTAEGEDVNLKNDSTLATFLDNTTPMGDTRTLTGLNDVIYLQQRTDLMGPLRSWMIDGRRHGGSALGYTKLWLYVIALYQKMQIDNDYLGTNWNFQSIAPSARGAEPNYEDRYTNRFGWNTMSNDIKSGSCGWATADDNTSARTLMAIADFYYPFPRWRVTTTNNQVGAVPFALGNSIPGTDNVLLTCRYLPAAWAPPAGPGPGTAAARVGVGDVTVQDYLEAIRQLKAWRYEDEDERIGFLNAISLAGGIFRPNLNNIPGLAVRRWPSTGLGTPGTGVRFEMPITNTLVAAYQHGTVMHQVDMGGRDVLTRDEILRLVHKFTICLNDSVARLDQLLVLPRGSLDARVTGAGSPNSRLHALNMMGPSRFLSESYANALFKYAFRVFGIRTCPTFRSMMYGRRVWEVDFRYAIWGGPRNTRIDVPAQDCAYYRTHARKPWQWEMLLEGSRQSEPPVVRVAGAGRRARATHTVKSHTALPTGHLVANGTQFTEFLVQVARGEDEEGGYANLRLSRRWSGSEDPGIMMNATEALANCLAPVAGLVGFRERAEWYVGYDLMLLRVFRNEVARADGGRLNVATYRIEATAVRQPGIDLSAYLPRQGIVVPRIGDFNFPAFAEPPGDNNNDDGNDNIGQENAQRNVQPG